MATRPGVTSRAARGSLVAVTSAALGLAAHGAAGGEAVELTPVLPLLLLTASAGTALAERSRTPWAVVGALVAAQAGQHALLALAAHQHHGPGLGLDPLAMTAAHVVAALLTGLLLARADAVLLALAGAAARLLPVLREPRPASRPAALPAPEGHPQPTPVRITLRRVNARRGPPALPIAPHPGPR
ncbi:hypothetical protein [Actinosynnema pretiosum]|uniref:Uncharacterized protein n=1 Tax=Actinosynnema pretiosum TaxID=42197 RepID=A0A290YYT3_9PSEU|nr:hypothetical protein [Actinosynnema pretiosum]ATE51905.1 hypothetical protein CNX65_00235 [Actinosynnema pretiosum]